MKWANPEMLVWLWALIPLAILLFALNRRKRRRIARLVEADLLPTLAPEMHSERIRLRLWIWLFGFGLLLLSLARPQWGYQLEEVKRRGMDVMVVLDTSNSMLAEDIKPNRLEQAKWAIRDLVKRLKGDRIGLILFAGSSFLECPLTIDYAAFLMTLDDAYAGIIPRGGTAITSALDAAVRGFESDSGSDRAIILITDGDDHEGNPLDMLPKLKKEQIRIYAVGVGTLEGELIPSSGESGHGGFLKNRRGEVVKSALREDSLEQLALQTGGIYVRSVPGDFGLDRIVDKGLSHLTRTEQESKTIRVYEDRYAWFAGPGLLLLLLEAAIRERKRNGVGS